MPLQDSLGSSDALKLPKMNAIPTSEDLKFALLQVTKKNGAKRCELSFQHPTNQHLFTVVVVAGGGTKAPTWTLIQGPNPGGKTLWVRSSSEIMIMQNKIKLDSNYVGPPPEVDNSAEAAWANESNSTDPSSAKNTSLKLPAPSYLDAPQGSTQPPQPMQMSFNQPAPQPSGGTPSLSDAMASAGYGQPPSFFGQAPQQMNFTEKPPEIPAEPNYPGAPAETYGAEQNAAAYPQAGMMPPGPPAGYEQAGFEPAAHAPQVQGQAHFAQAHPFTEGQAPNPAEQAPMAQAQAPPPAPYPPVPAQAPFAPAQSPFAPAQTPFAPPQMPNALGQMPNAPGQMPAPPAQMPNAQPQMPYPAAPPSVDPSPVNYGAPAPSPHDAGLPGSAGSTAYADASVSPQMAAPPPGPAPTAQYAPAASPQAQSAVPLPPAVQFDNELFTEVLVHLTDAQTGLVNYAAFVFFVFREFARFQALETPMSIAVFEVALLSQGNVVALPPNAVAAVVSGIREVCGPLNLVTHLGGGEFAALLPAASGADAAKFSAALHGALSESVINIGDQSCSMLVAIGAASVPETCIDPGVLFAAAGQAKEMTKSAGRFFMLFPTT